MKHLRIIALPCVLAFFICQAIIKVVCRPIAVFPLSYQIVSRISVILKLWVFLLKEQTNITTHESITP